VPFYSIYFTLYKSIYTLLYDAFRKFRTLLHKTEVANHEWAKICEARPNRCLMLFIHSSPPSEITNILTPYQFGSKKGHQAHDAIYTLLATIRNNQQFDKTPTYCAFDVFCCAT